MNLARSEVVGNLSNTAYLELHCASSVLLSCLSTDGGAIFPMPSAARTFLGLDRTPPCMTRGKEAGIAACMR